MKHYFKLLPLLLCLCFVLPAKAQQKDYKRVQEYYRYYEWKLNEAAQYVANYVAKQVTSRSKKEIKAEFIPYERMEVIESENLLVCPINISWIDKSTGSLCEVTGKLYSYLPYSMRDVLDSELGSTDDALGEGGLQLKARFRYETGNNFLFSTLSNSYLKSLKETRMLIIQTSGLYVKNKDTGIIRYE